MRIVLTNPFCWPYVRRGSERFSMELGKFLVDRGHDVTIVAAKPGAATVESTPSGTRILHRLLWSPAMQSLRLNEMHASAPGAFRSLWKIDADLVHSLYYLDAWIAQRTKRNRKRPLLFHVVGPPFPQGFRRMPPDRQMLRQIMREADETLAVSSFIADVCEQHYGRRPLVLPVPVDLTRFTANGQRRAARPTILSIAAFDERRKGVRVLVRAFARLKSRVSDAVLKLSGQISDSTRHEILDDLPQPVREDIHVLGAGRSEDLPGLYREAWVMALPSAAEGFGMALLEAWACGTPVVVSRHGSFLELLTDPRVGVFFEPRIENFEVVNDEEVALALAEGLELAGRPETTQWCQAHATKFGWDQVGPKYEQLYKEIAG